MKESPKMFDRHTQNFFTRIFATLFSCVLVAVFANGAQAGDDGLYGAPPPADAAFVRLLNAKTAGEMQSSEIGGQTLQAPAGSITPYVIASTTNAELENLLGQQPVAGGYYTIAFADSIQGSKVFSDEPLNDPAKGSLFFYNLTDKAAVELYVPVAKTAAIKSTAANEGSSVELKAPVKLDFVARVGAEDLATIPDITIKRRAPVSVVLFGTGGTYAAMSDVNTIDPVSKN
jgi:alginate O-acetyltransferase complex protein AlgF